MHRLVIAAAAITIWGGVARAQSTDDVVDMLASTIDEQRPLGSPPLLVVYVLLAALGVRIAVRKPEKEA